MKSEGANRILAGLLTTSLLVHDIGANGWPRMAARLDMPPGARMLPPAALRPAPAAVLPPEVKPPGTAPAPPAKPVRSPWILIREKAGRGIEGLRTGGRACVGLFRWIHAAAPAAEPSAAPEVRPLPAPWAKTETLSSDARRPDSAGREPEPARLPAPWDARAAAGQARRMLWVPEPAEPPARVPAPPAGKNPGVTVVERKGEPMLERLPERPRLQRLGSLSGMEAGSRDVQGFKSMSLTDWLQSPAPKTAALAPALSGGYAALAPLLGLQKHSKNQRFTTDAEFAQLGRRAKFLPEKSYTDLLRQDPGARFTFGYVPGEKYGVVTQMSDGTLYSTASPLVLDLDGDGVRTSERKVRFDLDGEGRYDYIHDISSKDGLLVFDSDKVGLAGENGRELFGNNTDLDGDGRRDGFGDGFAALKSLVEKAVREKVIEAEALRLRSLGPEELRRLEKAYGLGMRVGGFKSRAIGLKEAGIARIYLGAGALTRIADFDGQGNETLRQEGAHFSLLDGTIGTYEDVWIEAEHNSLRGEFGSRMRPSRAPFGSARPPAQPAGRSLRP